MEKELGYVITYTLDLLLLSKKLSSFIFFLYCSTYTNSKTLKDYLKNTLKIGFLNFFSIYKVVHPYTPILRLYAQGSDFFCFSKQQLSCLCAPVLCHCALPAISASLPLLQFILN